MLLCSHALQASQEAWKRWYASNVYLLLRSSCLGPSSSNSIFSNARKWALSQCTDPRAQSTSRSAPKQSNDKTQDIASPMSTHSRIELGTIGANQPPELNDAQSDEGSGDYQPMTSLLGRHVTQKEGLWKGLLKDGGLGEYLFHTSTGWHVWLGILVFWTGGCGFGLLLMNRFIMLTGIYK